MDRKVEVPGVGTEEALGAREDGCARFDAAREPLQAVDHHQDARAAEAAGGVAQAGELFAHTGYEAGEPGTDVGAEAAAEGGHQTHLGEHPRPIDALAVGRGQGVGQAPDATTDLGRRRTARLRDGFFYGRENEQEHIGDVDRARQVRNARGVGASDDQICAAWVAKPARQAKELGGDAAARDGREELPRRPRAPLDPRREGVGPVNAAGGRVAPRAVQVDVPRVAGLDRFPGIAGVEEALAGGELHVGGLRT